MFCDLVGSTALSTQLDPEELREVVRGYQRTSAAVIERFGGHIAQYLGDGLLVYFGYPIAHEDDARRAVRAGLEIVGAIKEQVTGDGDEERRQPLQVRIGIHTGPVVVGEMGGGAKRELLALGETPNLAARIQGQAAPNEVVISTATYRLVEGLFECEDRGQPALKGISTPLTLSRVVKESEAQSRFEVAIQTGLTPLVGRDEELELLRRKWEQAKLGEGQVVLLSGEPGMGKSRLVQELKNHIAYDSTFGIEFRCSPYHQNSALYPIIEHLQRLLQFEREDAPADKLEKLQHTLSHYRFPQADTVPLLAALLSLPHPAGSPPITVSPQKQKEKTQTALVAWLVEEAEKAAVYCAWEDLHWADPSTLEVLNLIVDQAPTARLYVLLTFRPEFMPPWGNRSHLSRLTLSRLGHQQVEAMVEKVTGGKALPREVLQQIVHKTDGVPLFVEELTKTVLESNLFKETENDYKLTGPLTPLAIPSTLQDSLMARLDRLSTVREIAQLGATLGREFSYELLQAVSRLDEAMLQQGLKQLVAAELVYQRGLVPQAHYLFKHALIQDAAYQSLLKSKRQQLHQQIAQVLTDRFPETVETQPEVLAHHYTEASLKEQAIPYWQKAGQRASQRSANIEAVAHLTKGLELLKTLPDTPEHTQQELTLQITLGPLLVATKGYAAPEVEYAYIRARELCRQVGETPQLFWVLFGLYRFYLLRAELQTARELAEQLLRLAQNMRDPTLLLHPHRALGLTLFHLGELTAARAHLQQSIALYDPQTHQPDRSPLSGQDPKVTSLSYAAWALWLLGYPDQARESSHEALALAEGLSHSLSLAFALSFAATLDQFRRERQQTHEQADAMIALCTDQGIPFFLAIGTILQGWGLAEQGQGEEGIAQMHQGMASFRATGGESLTPYYLALLAEAYGKGGQTKEGLNMLAEALAVVDRTGERYYEAELYRLRGELTLAQSKTSLGQVKTSQDKSEDTDPRPLTPDPQGEAEACFHKAIEIARRQQAKSLELRAVMSLVRLRQQQVMDSVSRNTHHAARTRLDEAHKMLSEIYNWFTEGLDTKDLREAKALIDGLESNV
jgi:class 3 adenylate cyclase/predicted ATPase